MEPEESYFEQIQTLYRNKLGAQQLQNLLKECKKKPEDMLQFLKELVEMKMMSDINFGSWGNFVRQLISAAKSLKDQKINMLLSQYLAKSANHFYSYPITPSNYKNMLPLLKISKNTIIYQPQNCQDHKHIILYINNPQSINNMTPQFIEKLLDLINTQVLIDKKNQEGKGFLKISPLYAKFIHKNFNKLIPIIERLMVRSQNNIEVIVEFIESCGKMQDIGEQIESLLKKYKNLFLTKSDLAIRFVKALTQNLNKDEDFVKSFEFMKGLLNSEHNAKKKIVYLRMLQGFIVSFKEFNLSQKLVGDLIAAVATSWAKFVEEAEANYVFQILTQLLPLVKEPFPQIAEACKASLKSQNRYILIFTGLTLSASFKSSQDFENFPIVKQCFTTSKVLLQGWMKKKQANWHFILPFINFLSAYQLDLVEDLPQINPIFKKSMLALNLIQQIDLLDLFSTKYIPYLLKQQDNNDQQILSEQFCINWLILLQSVGGNARIWDKYIAKIPRQVKLQIIRKGLYPLVYLQPNNNTTVSRNKGNKFNSLTRYLLIKGLSQSKLSLKECGGDCLERLVTLAAAHRVPLGKFVNTNLKNIDQEEKEKFNEEWKKISQKYIQLSILPVKIREMNQKYYIINEQHNIHQRISHNLFEISPIPAMPYIKDILHQLLNKNCYEKDRSFIEKLQEKLKKLVKQHFEDKVNNMKEKLVEMQYYTEPKIPPKKIYLNPVLDAKMMSEEEVKKQQYMEHFNNMMGYYHALTIEIILPKITCLIRSDGKDDLWSHTFEQFIHIVEYPQHRNGVYRLVKATFQNMMIDGEQKEEIAKLKKLFLRYSLFFAEFYSIRGAHMTPTISQMQKAQKFLKELLDANITPIPRGHYAIDFVEDLSLYVLENMEFDLEVKDQALNFCYFCIQRGFQMQNEEILYTHLAKNINIISGCENIQPILLHCMQKVSTKRYGQLFVEILNYINKTKILILKVLVTISESDSDKDAKKHHQPYNPTFEDYIKLRILALDDSLSEEISSLATKILSIKSQQTANISVTIAHFDMKNFIKNNNKETIEKLCKFMTQSINKTNINDVMQLALSTASELYDQHFDQEGLEFLPYFLSLNIDKFPDKYLHKIFEVLVLRYTSNDDFVTLSKLSVEIGIQIIKKYAPTHGQKLLLSMESFLTKAKGISNIVFLGVLAPYLKGNKNLNVIEKRVTELFQGDNQSQQRSIAKCMPDLMSFFKNPDQIVAKILEDISGFDEKKQIGQSYLFSGLLKGLGHRHTLNYLEKVISKEYPTKTKGQKSGRICLIRAFIENFGRVIELRGIIVIEILLHYMSDANEDIRTLSKTVAQIFVTKMSSYAIKQLLPQLLSGLQNQQNWRIKISYIWILGIMANCAAKQLQTSLPIIVPTLSACLSNAHPNIRDKASQALKLIGETIKNPEISNSIDILIQALENPFQKSTKAVQLLLKTRFSHYIDPPSLSIIVPIVDYCLRGRITELKEYACQVIGSITELILKPSDILPYLRILAPGIRIASCDPLPEIRSIAAMAIGKISAKIGADYAKQYFNFIFEIIDSHTSNTTEKTGAAQAYAELICSQDYDYFQESLSFIFSKLTQDTNKTIQKEGYILVFLFVPSIRRAQFQSFIKQVNQNTYCYVSDEEEALRNSSMQVSKVLINNYGISHTGLLIEPLCQAIFQENWRKRNAALILLGELLNILKNYMFNTKTNDKAPYYYQALMAVYIMKDDTLQMPRVTANQVWNMYIENTPKTIRSGLKVLVKMWTRFTHAAGGVVYKNIIGFSAKYAENYFTDILEYLEEFVMDPLNKRGVFDVLGELLKRMAKDFLSKNTYKKAIRKFFDTFIFSVDASVREALTNCLALYVEKMHEEEYFQNLIYPSIDKMAEESQQNKIYTEMLHLIRDLLNTSSGRVVDRLISKVIEPPLSEFKIEVITNNADKIADNLYTLFKTPATQSMLEETLSLIGSPQKANRLSLLVYCLNQVSIRLNNKFKTMYSRMLMNKLREIRNKSAEMKDKFLPSVDQILGMLAFFLQSIDLKNIDSLEELIGEISPYVFIGNQSIQKNAHKIFMILISDNKSTQTGAYYKQMIVSLQNQSAEQAGKVKDTKIWHEEEIIKDYINVLVKGLAYGSSENLRDGLQMLNFFIHNTSSQILSPLIVRVMGPIIRVASYGIYQREKERLLEFIRDLYSEKHSSALEVFNYQVVSVCLRILSESYSTKKGDIIEQIALTLFSVISNQSNNKNREFLLDFIISKAKGEEYVELLYFLIKKIIINKPDLIPNQIYAKIQSQFQIQLINTVQKMSVKGNYMMSKVVAMIYVFLKQEDNSTQGNTFEDLLLYLQKAAEKKEAVPKMDKIELLMKESSRQKVFYLLKSIQDCRDANIRTKQVYTYEYANSLVPESLSGFEDIKDIIDYFE